MMSKKSPNRTAHAHGIYFTAACTSGVSNRGMNEPYQRGVGFCSASLSQSGSTTVHRNEFWTRNGSNYGMVCLWTEIRRPLCRRSKPVQRGRVSVTSPPQDGLDRRQRGAACFFLAKVIRHHSSRPYLTKRIGSPQTSDVGCRLMNLEKRGKFVLGIYVSGRCYSDRTSTGRAKVRQDVTVQTRILSTVCGGRACFSNRLTSSLPVISTCR